MLKGHEVAQLAPQVGPDMMTRQEAKALKSFKNHCNCGGHAWQVNGRPQAQPHMDWCPQRDEYAGWWRALNG